MGIYDRDYYHQDDPPRGGFAAMRMWTVTTWLLVINVAVFLIDQAMASPRNFGMSPLKAWGYFSLATAIGDWQIWRFLTFQFLHASPMHLIFNMLGLYFFGPLVESHFGPRRYLAFYLSCGMAGAASYLILWMFGFLITSPIVPLVGASAGLFGILMAAAWLAPDVQVMLWFPPIPMKLKTMAWLMMGIAAYTVLADGRNAGGEAAHLGGGLLGLAFMSTQHWLNPFAPFRKPRWRMRMHKNWTRDFNR